MQPGFSDVLEYLTWGIEIRSRISVITYVSDAKNGEIDALPRKTAI